MKISIIIPVYNSGRNIIDCLSSIMESTFDDFETIVVDDASMDNSANIVNEFIVQNNEDNIYLIESKINKRAGGARNLGILRASGDYILFVDQDDKITPELLEELYLSSSNGAIDCISCDVLDKNSKVYRRPDFLTRKTLSLKHKIDLIINHGYIFGTLIKRSLIEKHKLFFPEDVMFEDVLYNLALFAKVNSFSHTKHIGYLRTIDRDSQTAKLTLKKLDDRITSADWYYRKLVAYPEYESLKDLIGSQYMYYVCSSNIWFMLWNINTFNYSKLKDFVRKGKMIPVFWKVSRFEDKRFALHQRVALEIVYLLPIASFIFMILYNISRVCYKNLFKLTKLLTRVDNNDRS